MENATINFCPPMKHVVWFRLYLIAQTVLTVAASWLSITDPVYALLRVGGLLAVISALTLLGLSSLALVDVFLSETCSPLWTKIKRRRWLIWLAMGTAYSIQAALAINYGFAPWLALMFSLAACGCAIVATLDIKYRFKDEKEKLCASGHAEFDSKLTRRAWDV